MNEARLVTCATFMLIDRDLTSHVRHGIFFSVSTTVSGRASGI